MNNPTDTYQASEDKLREAICKIFGVFPEELEFNLPGGISLDKCQKLEALIRTEKLKLLAEVRERVVGEDERIDIQSDYDKLDVPHLETDRYPGLHSVRQASRNLCREHQRAELSKLEAEL